ncbi:MAG: hypothetical protein SFY68_08065 [Candidatus Sumerlaeia bacterium]|nr:hypothetical protein [Candidatus Sumerlaeia bacterium]
MATSEGFRVRYDSIVNATGSSSNSQFRELRGAVSIRDPRPSTSSPINSPETTGEKSPAVGIRESGFLFRLPNTPPIVGVDVDAAVWFVN